MVVYQPTGCSHIHWYTHTVTTACTMAVLWVAGLDDEVETWMLVFGAEDEDEDAVGVGAKGPSEQHTTSHHPVSSSSTLGSSTSAHGPGDTVSPPAGMALHGMQ
jgi:hypothetical protein